MRKKDRPGQDWKQLNTPHMWRTIYPIKKKRG